MVLFYRSLSVLKLGTLLLLLSVLAACSTVGRVDIEGPSTARPIDPQKVAAERPPTGSIYQGTTVGYRPLFEDRRARNIGDTLVVNLQENIRSEQANNASASRSSSMFAGIPILSNLPLGFLEGAEASAKGGNEFDSKGKTGASNMLTGTIAVTVIEVLPNGNLVVAGEKQIGTNSENERIRLTGVVNPNSIVNSNQVSSTQIADARLEYKGEGTINEAVTAGWLTSFFFSWLPF